MFKTHAARIAAGILSSQCQDLGMSDIQAHPTGEVQAQLQGRDYLFRWDVSAQAVQLVAVEPPFVQEIRLCA